MADRDRNQGNGAGAQASDRKLLLLMNTLLLYEYLQHAEAAGANGQIFGDYSELQMLHTN